MIIGAKMVPSISVKFDRTINDTAHFNKNDGVSPICRRSSQKKKKKKTFPLEVFLLGVLQWSQLLFMFKDVHAYTKMYLKTLGVSFSQSLVTTLLDC